MHGTLRAAHERRFCLTQPSTACSSTRSSGLPQHYSYLPIGTIFNPSNSAATFISLLLHPPCSRFLLLPVPPIMSSCRSLLALLLLSVLWLSLIASSRACGPSCMTGYYYLERPGFNYSSNGCGSYGVSVSAPFGANTCCQYHDYCYSNCSTSKDSCDSTFDSCLDTQCSTLNSTVDRDACKGQADLFYSAVVALGCPAYDSAQDAACECSTTANYTGNGTVYYLGSGAMAGSTLHAAVLLAVLIITAVISL